MILLFIFFKISKYLTLLLPSLITYRSPVRLLFLFTFCHIKFTFSQPSIPKFQSYQPIKTQPPSSGQQPQLPVLLNATTSNNPTAERNLHILQQSPIINLPGPTNIKQQQLEEVREMLREEAIEHNEGRNGRFQNNFKQFLQLNPDNFSITKAIYLSESAYDLNMPPFEVFEAGIKEWAELVRQILKREGLNEKNNIAINYAIQKLYTQRNVYYNAKTKSNYDIPPLRYDFEDFMGNKDWKKMFVSKLLRTKTGQCHNMPLFYMCVAEQLNAKVYLSLSPNHSFIQYFDEKGNRYNFETTNGNLVSQNWLIQSTFVNSTSLKKKTYLDTLSSRKLYAQSLSDLLLGYLMKNGYDDFSNQITQQILSIDSWNITALMVQSNYYTYIFSSLAEAAGNPPKSEFSNYPRLYTAYKTMQDACKKVEQTGFQEMPKEVYQRWLKSLELEKQKQQTKLEQERMQREIRKLKNIKPIFINTPKE